MVAKQRITTWQRWLAVGVLAGLAIVAAPAAARPLGLAPGRAEAGVQAVVRYGQRGPAVAELQRLLQRSGYGPGKIDGIFGARTLRAVRRFQQAHGLRVDGVAGPVTLRALRNGARPAARNTASSERFIWPARNWRITSHFGPRPSPCPGCSTLHKGLDIAGRHGDPVLASKSGRVAISSWLRGYGNVIYLNHRDGSQTRYAHLQARYVGAGRSVYQGQTIGEVGNTGHSSGPHLHFEILRQGKAVNPLPYLS